MKAVVCEKYGDVNHLVMKEMTQPSPKSNEVLIQIKATSVTTSDVLLRKMDVGFIPKILLQMIFGFGKPKNPILGMVTAGTVANVGEKVTQFKKGDDIFAYGSISPMKRHFGSYAEYICLPEDWNIALKPINLSFEEAAALPYGGLLATHIVEKAKIQKGNKVLIYGASGSIGTMALQLAKVAGAEVTSVCSAKNFELVKALGSDKVLDYNAPSALKELENYDVVLDAVGNSKNSAFKEVCKVKLTQKGRYVSIDHGTPLTPKSAFLRLKSLAEEKRIIPVIDKVYALNEMQAAHTFVETGRKRGNVIIKVAD